MERIRLLLVDDEEEFVNLFVKRFNMRNLDAFGVTSGRAALGYLAEHPVDVVVLDVKMPGMDGLAALGEIKKRFPTVEVIMLTGHGSLKSGVEGMSLGAFDYVLKPFRIDDLLDRIRKAAERKRLMGE
ncbi:MAG: two-component system, OmpR family, response regulator [Desulfovibrionales bacterium]|jgi:DNA-binding response OmpR family regulator|nr:two-component system, OmpR family, response regulator [Desulfovibrionales bacterium]